MQQRARGSAAIVVMVLLVGVALAAANLGALSAVVKGGVSADFLRDLAQQAPAVVAYLAAAPVAFSLLAALLVGSGARATGKPAGTGPAAAAPSPPEPPSPAAALRLLALLQQESRFVDFVMEDIDAYSDEQVGAAARSIHAGCRKALADRVHFERVFAQEDGADVSIEPGFDPAAVRLTGNVSGEPPFRGTLAHGGWRAARVSLPVSPGGTPAEIIAPAEVEIA